MERNQVFREFYFSLPPANRKVFREKICTESGVSYQTFRFWLIGKTQIPTLVFNLFNKIKNENY